MNDSVFRRVGYTYISVSNIEESIKWYQEILRLELIDRFTDRGSKIAIFHFADKSSCAIVLVETSEVKPLKIIRDNKEHPYLSIASSNLDITYQYLLEKQVNITTEIESLGDASEARYFYFTDPDGNLFEASWSIWDE